MIKIERYHKGLDEIWNTCNAQAVNGTFLFDRCFLAYHRDRFTDHSLLFFRKNKLIALLPLHEENDLVASHRGLSFGGFIITKEVDTAGMLRLFESLKIYLVQQGFRSLVYKSQPFVYPTQPAQDDLVWLYHQNAQLVQRTLLSVLDLTRPLAYSKLRQRCLRQAKASNLVISRTTEADAYMQLVEDLYYRAGVGSPTHTAAEIQYLMQAFPENINLLAAYSNQELVGGVLLFIHPQVVNLQYIATSEQGKQNYALDLLVDRVMDTYRNTKKYLSFGSSQDSREPYQLNLNLLQNKSSYGARGVVQDTYQLNF